MMNNIEIITTSYQNNFTTPLYDSIKSKFKYAIGDVIVNNGERKFHITSQFDEYHLSRSQFHLELIQIFRGLSWIFENKLIEPGGFIKIYTTQPQMIPLIGQKLMLFNDQLVDSPDNLISLSNIEILNHLMLDHNIFPERLKTFSDIQIELDNLLTYLKEFNNGFYLKVFRFNGSFTDKMKPSELCETLLETNFDQCKASVLYECDKVLNLSEEQIKYDIEFRKKCGKLSKMINGVGYRNSTNEGWIKPIDVRTITRLIRIQKYLKYYKFDALELDSSDTEVQLRNTLNEIKSKQYEIISNICKL